MNQINSKLEKLEAKVNNLESQIRFLLQINGLDLSELRTAPDDVLLSLYRDAVQLLGYRSAYDPEVVKRWAEIFVQLSEYEFIRIQELVDYHHTWEPFYQLCIRTMTSIRQNKDLPTTVGLQHLYALLEKGRKNLRDAAILIVKRSPEKLSPVAETLLKDGKPTLPKKSYNHFPKRVKNSVLL